MSVKFKDNSVEVKGAIDNAVEAFLHEVGGEVRGEVQRNTATDTGQLKGSWKFNVNVGASKVVIGSPLQNAIWEEYGTGIYAEGGKGRQDVPWTYQDARGNFHRTKGKRPKRAFRNAIDTLKPKITQVIKDKFGAI